MDKPPYPMECLARLVSWETTNCPLGRSRRRVCFMKLCPGICRNGEDLCEKCKQRPKASHTQTKMIHGLLTEPPPPESVVYGGEFYWKSVAEFGEPYYSEWLELAEEAQEAGEERCRVRGKKPWKVQRPSDEVLAEMPPKKKVVAKAVKKQMAEATPPKKGPLFAKFPTITTVYEESAKAPETLPTDSCRMWKEQDMWVTETGLVFQCTNTGEPGELIGKKVDGEFVAVE